MSAIKRLFNSIEKKLFIAKTNFESLENLRVRLDNLIISSKKLNT